MTAAPFLAGAAAKERPVSLEVGTSQTVGVALAIDKVIVTNPAIADVTVFGGNQLLITAKAAGETQVVVTSNSGKSWTYRILSSAPTTVIQSAIEDLLPGNEIQVRSAGNIVFLTGRVADATIAETADRIARSVYGATTAPSSIVNLIQVGGSQQVQVRLKFVEVSRSALRAMGVNAWTQGRFAAGQPERMGALVGPGSLAVVPAQPSSGVQSLSPTLPFLAAPVSGSFGIMFSQLGATPLSVTLAVLQNRGFAKTLSEPTLVAMSGQKASFLAGGEFPIPVPTNFGQVSIEFKNFGVQLEFTPTVLSEDTVQLSLRSVVSELDSTAGVVVSNVSVPGLTARESSTTVRLRDHQSFAIAGLLSDTMRSNVSKVPLLGDLPILGMLFRSVHYTRSETELVVMVSVDLVRPLAAGSVPVIPGEDEFSDPGDLRLFLMGTIEAGEPVSPVGEKKRPSAAVHQTGAAPAGAIGFLR